MSKSGNMQKEIEVLNRELEIAEYAINGHGHARRKPPRRMMRERTRKRKLLEKEDHHRVPVGNEERTRGSRIAMDEKFLQDSHLLNGNTLGEKANELTSDDDDDDTLDSNDSNYTEKNAGNETDEDVDENFEEIDDDDVDVIATDEIEHIDGDFSNQYQSPHDNTSQKKGTESKASTSFKSKSIKRKSRRRTLYRMKNFKSVRMAERHGEALGAHARGQPLLAIEKLQQVAADAPTAPQVYTSLGMIYEDMLTQEDPTNWKDCIEVAKKAYGSYHIAAVLCKKDYMVWVRAADTARKIADLFTVAMKENPEEYRTHVRYWIQEAQKDYQTADNLKPPGLDVPVKLAAAHMDLGNLSDALSILTSIKKQTSGHTHKTWMLYADLMLKIGFECQQWNSGVEYNRNYMFRRWLRKYSKSFDWKERRLQALVLALEAAAGSDNCREILQWVMNRAKEKAKLYSQAAVPTAAEEKSSATEATSTTTTTKPITASTVFTQTISPNVGDSSYWYIDDYDAQAGESTISVCQATIQESKGDVVDIQAGKNQCDIDSSISYGLEDGLTQDQSSTASGTAQFSNSNIITGTNSSQNRKNIPVSASCSTVCSIASELMKHCLGLDQYLGSRLVAESVSLYLKARAAVRMKRVQSTLDFQSRQQSTATEILLGREDYDEMVDDDSVSEDDEIIDYISDEDAMDDDPKLLLLLEKGVLTPELQVLLALSLMGEGKKDFLAAKCILSLSDLENDCDHAIQISVVDNDPIGHPAWLLYRHAMTDQLRAVSALAFTADMLKKVKKEEIWAHLVSPYFQQAIESMQASGILVKALEAERLKVNDTIIRRTQVLKIVAAGTRYNVFQCLRELPHNERADEEVNRCIEQVSCTFKYLWHIDESGLPSKSSTEALEIVGHIFRLIDFVKDQEAILEKVEALVDCLVGSSNSDEPQNESLYNTEWARLPMSSSWQSDRDRLLSLRAYNLCVANSVSLFSGWENMEFNLDLMQRKRKNNYFGITLREGRIIGLLTSDIKQQLSEAWSLAKVATGLDYNFSESHEKALDFLVNENQLTLPRENEAAIAAHGERVALNFLLDFAKLCLKVASNGKCTSNTKLIKSAMSFLLPVTQFSVLDHIWDTSLGRATGSLAGLDEWRILAGRAQTRISQSLAPKPLRKHQRRAVEQWYQTELSLITRIVVVPIKCLNSIWNDHECDVETNLADAVEYQERLHNEVIQLRMSSTELRVQKSSLKVTLALLEMIPHVQNPFLLLQQAALFASQCAKGGDMDVHFKIDLPLVHECSAMNALSILARAECLQAVHFSEEATFLCSFVVRCCQFHRERSQLGAMWTPQWKVIGITAYNVAMATRSTICSTQFDKDSQRKALEIWDDETLSELERCRADAIATKKSIDGDFVANEPSLEEEDDKIIDENELAEISFNDSECTPHEYLIQAIAEV